MGWFSSDSKFVSKEDGTKYKEEKYEGAAKYQKIEEDPYDRDYHDTYGAVRTADGSYTEFYHGGNLSNSEKAEFGSQIDNAIDNGPHHLGK